MRRDVTTSELIMTLGAVLLAGTAPNLFPIAQAGYAKFSTLGEYVLLPVVFLLVGLYIFAVSRAPRLADTLRTGAAAGTVATLGLEVVREIGYHLGWMPGDMPMLMGVQLLDQFMEGPSLLSNLAGWGYHFWNGASFGIIMALLLGRVRWWAGPVYGILIGVGFMVSPVVTAIGVGKFGTLSGPGFAVTVTVAHIVFGIVLGAILERRLKGEGIVSRLIADDSPVPAL